MNKKTATNLKAAFAGESQAHMRYMSWADKASQDGFPVVEKLFNAISYAESIHAKSHFRVLKDEHGAAESTSGGAFGIGTTSENLQLAAEGENFEITEMYPAFIKDAEAEGEKAAIRSMQFALEAERSHEELYLKAKTYTDEGKDADFEGIYICEVCGFASYGEMEDKCPICNAPKAKYRTF